MPEISITELQEAATLFGLHVVEHLPLAAASSALVSDVSHLADWQDKGFAAELDYMQRDPKLFVDFEHFLPGIRSIVCFAVSYYWRDEENTLTAELPTGFGRVARYAWGRDYHRVLKKRLQKLAKHLEAEVICSPLKTRVFTDAVPLLERALARSADLGFIGKNSLLIRPGIGSYTLLGELLWDVEIEAPEQERLPIHQDASCKTCSRCIDACPTAAIVDERTLDAGKCISYLSIEKKGGFDDWQRQALGEWVFGCDICQEVCPFNHEAVAQAEIEEFSARAGIGPLLDLEKTISLRGREEFLATFQGTPLMRTGRLGLLRNAAAVIANTKATICIDGLLEMEERDCEEVLRLAAFRALESVFEVATGSDRRKIQERLNARPKRPMAV